MFSKLIKFTAVAIMLSSLLLCSTYDKAEAKSTATSELKSIKKYADKGTTKATKAVKIGDHASKVRKSFGKPNDVYQFKEMELLFYKGNPSFYINYYPQYYLKKGEQKSRLLKNTKIVSIDTGIKNKKSYTYAQIKKVFGKTKDYGYNNFANTFSISYAVGKGKYKIYFTTDEKHTKYNQKFNSKLKYVSITVSENW